MSSMLGGVARLEERAEGCVRFYGCLYSIVLSLSLEIMVEGRAREHGRERKRGWFDFYHQPARHNTMSNSISIK